MKLVLPKGDTSRRLLIFIQDSSSTTGAGLTSLVFNSAGLTAYYARPGAAAAAITLATQTVTGAYSSGGFVEVDSTNMPGVYRFDPPDAVLASGVDSVVVMLKGATNMAPLALEIQLSNVNLNDGVRAALTALPNAAAEAAGGLYTRGTGAGQINQDANGRIDSNTAAISADSVAADNAEAFFDGTGYAGTGNTIPTVTNVTNTVSANTIQISGDSVAADNAEAFFDGTGYAGTNNVIPSVTTVTGNVNGSVNSVTTQVTANTTSISGDSVAADKLEAWLDGMVTGTADSGSTTTIVDTERTEADTDYWKGSLVLFTSGTIVGQCRLITGFNQTTDTITFAPATTQAVATNTYVIIPAGRADLQLWLGSVVNALVSGRVDADMGAISTDATAANNAESFFDGTGYAGTGNTIPTVTSVTNQVTADVTAISGDSVAADNAEAFFDGTGYAGTNNVIPSVTTVTGNVNGSVGSLGATAKTDVNAEVVDALATDTYAEPSGVPAATASITTKLNFLAALARNKITQTATTQTLRNDADSGNIATSTVSDDGTTFTRGEFA